MKQKRETKHLSIIWFMREIATDCRLYIKTVKHFQFECLFRHSNQTKTEGIRKKRQNLLEIYPKRSDPSLALQ